MNHTKKIKQNKAKNHHIHNSHSSKFNNSMFNTSTINISKQIRILFTNSTYNIIKANHLYDERTPNKQRDQFIDNTRYKHIILLALQNGLNSFRSKGEVVVTIANSSKKNHSCTSILIALDKYNNVYVITAIQTYGNKKWYRGFTKVHNRINIMQSVYILERLSDKEINLKQKDRIFNKQSEDQYKEDKLFTNYVKKNNLKTI